MNLQKKKNRGKKCPQMPVCYLYIIIIEYLGWLTFETYSIVYEAVC